MAKCIFLVLLLSHFEMHFCSSVLNHIIRLGGIPYVSSPEIKGDFNSTSHFQYIHIKKYCNVSNWDTICKSNDTCVCAVRPVVGNVVGQRKDMQYKDYKNWCYLFLSNMCENPSHEYSIVWDSDCDSYFTRRRNEEESDTSVITASSDDAVTTNADNPSTTFGYGNLTTIDVTDANGTQGMLDYSTITGNLTALRTQKKDWPQYKTDFAHDYHPCPLSCPQVYDPICININKGFGKSMKLLTFKNHCLGDLYYCQHVDEFVPPPNMDEPIVISSRLSWSYCAAYKYISFARFTEAASSMAHYGWLAGDYTARHILEPHQRMPGYG